MDSRTGQIYIDPDDETKKRIGDAFTPIPPEEVEKVVNMNRRQRRAWAKQKRRRQQTR